MPSENLQNDSGDYTRFGIPDAPKTTVTTPFGKMKDLLTTGLDLCVVIFGMLAINTTVLQAKTCAGLEKWEIIYLTLSFMNIIATIGLTTYSLVKVMHDPKLPDFTFTILIIVNAAFIAFYALHGVLRERKYELYVQVAAIGVILIYCIVEYSVNVEEQKDPVKIARLITACVLAPPNIALSIYVARDFGELEFRIAGASAHLQSIYNDAAIFSCLLKFDLQVTVSLIILVLEKGKILNRLDIFTLAVGIPFTLLWDICGWIVLRLELKVGSFIFACFGLVKPAYCAYKIYELFGQNGLARETNIIKYGVLISCAFEVLVWLMLMVNLYRVYRNYDQGLREQGKISCGSYTLGQPLEE